jgi:hypothetical protein
MSTTLNLASELERIARALDAEDADGTQVSLTAIAEKIAKIIATWHLIVFEGMRINRETSEFIGEDSKRTDSFRRQSQRGDPSQPQGWNVGERGPGFQLGASWQPAGIVQATGQARKPRRGKVTPRKSRCNRRSQLRQQRDTSIKMD